MQRDGSSVILSNQRCTDIMTVRIVPYANGTEVKTLAHELYWRSKNALLLFSCF